MRWSSASPSTSGIAGGEEVGLDAARALDLRRHLELCGAELVVERHGAGELLVEAVALGVEGDLLLRPLHVDVVGVVDEVERGDPEQHAGDAEPQVEARQEEGESRSGEVPRERPLVVAPPHADGASLLRGEGDHAREERGVDDEVDHGGAERRQDLGHEGAVRRSPGQVHEPGEVRRDDVVADVERDLEGVVRDPGRRDAAHGGDGHRRPEPEGDEAGEDGDERERHVPDPGELDLAEVGQRRQDHERDDVEGEGRGIVQAGGERDAGRAHADERYVERDGRAFPHGRLVVVQYLG